MRERIQSAGTCKTYGGATFVVLLLCSACSKSPPGIEPGISRELAEWRAATISDVYYRPSFVIPASADAPIHGRIGIRFELTDVSAPLQLDFRATSDHVESLLINGRETNWRYENEHIVVPQSALLEGRNEIDVAFIAGDSSLNRNPDYLYTLFVPDRARTAFPLFDQPDLKASFELSLTVPAEWTALSNAPVAFDERYDGTREMRFQPSDRLSSYLFSFVAGRFETITAERDGRKMTMLHRETDAQKVLRNVDEIFDLHAAALRWLEEYTGIDYPWQKFDFALIPAFQYGGMEHVGAIQYRDTSLFLDESPSDNQRLSRASLIAHETAHMWFGNLVTMAWFDDVWTKEVFANFMAAKIVNPSFPDIDHDLNFLLRHYPSAYGVDRTEGANPIRQALPNLNEAGQMYGAIIYNKAPIMMRQLEQLIGEAAFRDGMQEYLRAYSFGNATWPALIEILDARTDADLREWSEIWVNSPGRPAFDLALVDDVPALVQRDPAGRDRTWPQQFSVSKLAGDVARIELVSSDAAVPLGAAPAVAAEKYIFNADGMGYGLFPHGGAGIEDWPQLRDVEKGSLLIHRFENVLMRDRPAATGHLALLADIIAVEENQLLLDLALDQLRRAYWLLVPENVRDAQAAALEKLLWEGMLRQTEGSKRKMFFAAFADIALTPDAVKRVYGVWSGTDKIDTLPLSENDFIGLAQVLAIKMPTEADAIISTQIAMTRNPDSLRKLEFIAPSMSADVRIRDRFFFSLRDEKNRETESWVLNALENLHHPLRVRQSEEYIYDSLKLLEEIQVTGDIFFPKRWLDATLSNHRSHTAVSTVRRFLSENPGYNAQLRMKILQSADMMFRANALASQDFSD